MRLNFPIKNMFEFDLFGLILNELLEVKVLKFYFFQKKKLVFILILRDLHNILWQISHFVYYLRSLQQDQQQKNSNNSESETQSRYSDSRSKEWFMNSHPRLSSTLLSPSMNPVTNVEATVSSASETSNTSYKNLENHQESSSTNDDDKAKSTT